MLSLKSIITTLFNKINGKKFAFILLGDKQIRNPECTTYIYHYKEYWVLIFLHYEKSILMNISIRLIYYNKQPP